MSTDRIAFVTGGTGFVGSHLVEQLLSRGFDEVRCLVRTDLKWLRGLHVVPIRGTLHDTAALRDGLRGATHVFHVAGLTRSTDADALIEANATGTVNLLRSIEKSTPSVQHVQLTSSLAAVGTCEEPIATEESPLRPISAYGRSKALMEHRVLGTPVEVDGDAAMTATLADWSERLPISVVRPPAVYGPRETDIFTFFKAVERGFCPVVGSGRRPELSLVHVSDLTRGMADLAESAVKSGSVFFIGSERYYSWSEIRRATVVALRHRVITVRVPKLLVPAIGAASELWGRVSRTYPPLNREKANEILHACKMCSVDSAIRAFGYREQLDLQTGIAETVEWYRREGWLRA